MRRVGLASVLLLGVAAFAIAGSGGWAARGEWAAGAAGALPPSPPLEGVDLDGGAFRLGALRGEVVVLIFQRSPRCGICRDRLRALAAHDTEYADLGARVVTIVPGPADAWRGLADELGLDVPVVVASRSTLERWGVWPRGERAPRPAAFVLDERGRVRFRHIGQTGADRVGDVALLASVRGIHDSGAVRVGR